MPKVQMEHYDNIEQFFRNANRQRKTLVRCKLKGMSEQHLLEWRFYLARRHFNGGSDGFQLSVDCVVKLWEHYNGY